MGSPAARGLPPGGYHAATLCAIARADIVVVPKRELLDASLTILEADYRRNLERRLRDRR